MKVEGKREKKGYSMEKKEKIQRQANLELLRIFCIITIIVHHYCVWGGIIDVDTNFGNQMIGNLGMMIGKISSNIFILISGYFLFTSHFKIQRVLKLMLELVFYSILVNVAMAMIFKDANIVNYISISAFPIFFEIHWFVTAFIGMYVLLPFFKKALKDISQKSYFTILCVLGIILSILPSIISVAFDRIINDVFGNIIFFLYLAMIGGYIARFNSRLFKKKRYNILAILAIFLLFHTYEQYISINYILVLIVAILVFDLFLKLNVKNNKVINFLAPASLGVLLLHDNRIFSQTIWKDIFHTESYYYVDTYQLILHILICVFCIYLIGSVIDYIRRKSLEKMIFTKLDKNKVLNQINDAFNE